jgi:hypothetical protein
MALGQRSLAQVVFVVFILLGLASCVPPEPIKRPVTSGGEQPPAKKPNTGPTTSAPPPPPAAKKAVSADMTIKEVLVPQKGTAGQKRETYFRKFVAQKGVAAVPAFQMPARDPPQFTDNEIKTIASSHFTWLLTQDEAENEAFWSYEITDGSNTANDKKICNGNLASVTWAPGVGIGSSTIPPGYLKQSDARILYSVAGDVKKHGEDGTYIKQEANFPAGTTRYPTGTVNYSFGHPPSHFMQSQIVRGTTQASTETYDKGCVLKKQSASSQENIAPARYPPCDAYSGRNSKSCSAVGAALGVRFIN